MVVVLQKSERVAGSPSVRYRRRRLMRNVAGAYQSDPRARCINAIAALAPANTFSTTVKMRNILMVQMACPCLPRSWLERRIHGGRPRMD